MQPQARGEPEQTSPQRQPPQPPQLKHQQQRQADKQGPPAGDRKVCHALGRPMPRGKLLRAGADDSGNQQIGDNNDRAFGDIRVKQAACRAQVCCELGPIRFLHEVRVGELLEDGSQAWHTHRFSDDKQGQSDQIARMNRKVGKKRARSKHRRITVDRAGEDRDWKPRDRRHRQHEAQHPPFVVFAQVQPDLESRGRSAVEDILLHASRHLCCHRPCALQPAAVRSTRQWALGPACGPDASQAPRLAGGAVPGAPPARWAAAEPGIERCVISALKCPRKGRCRNVP